MGKMKDQAIMLDNIEAMILSALRMAVDLEQDLYDNNPKGESTRFFEQVSMPLNQILDYLRNGNESDYV